MTRGTTPDIIAIVKGVDLTDLAELYVTLKQGSVVVEKSLDEVLIEDKHIHVTLTQEETLSFTAGSDYQIQVRGVTNDGMAFASNIRERMVTPVLKDGVI